MNHASPSDAARAEILSRIRGALTDLGPDREDREREPPVVRDYERERQDPGMLPTLQEHLHEYRAHVRRIEIADIGETVGRICGELGLHRLVVAAGVPEAWRPPGVELLDDTDEAASDPKQLDALDGVLTGCAVAIAETGTIVLDGGPRSGRRAISLVPDHHICVVEADQVVMLVPEAFARLEQAVRERRAPVTLISGPSATSDIELNRVEGVHGPRTLVVLLAQ